MFGFLSQMVSSDNKSDEEKAPRFDTLRHVGYTLKEDVRKRFQRLNDVTSPALLRKIRGEMFALWQRELIERRYANALRVLDDLVLFQFYRFGKVYMTMNADRKRIMDAATAAGQPLPVDLEYYKYHDNFE